MSAGGHEPLLVPSLHKWGWQYHDGHQICRYSRCDDLSKERGMKTEDHFQSYDDYFFHTSCFSFICCFCLHVSLNHLSDNKEPIISKTVVIIRTVASVRYCKVSMCMCRFLKCFKRQNGRSFIEGIERVSCIAQTSTLGQ